MPFVLGRRRVDLVERMDRPDADLARLFRTYDGFKRINPVFSRWKSIYRRWMLPEMQSQPGGRFSMLDIGCGGADLIEAMVGWAAQDGFQISATGIDPDERVARYITLHPHKAHFHFRQCRSADLVREGLQFDFVICNHVMHHLGDDELRLLFGDAQKLAKRRALFNDIERGDLAWAVFHLTWPFFPGSFITPDGLTSIRRSYTQKELAAVAPEVWKIHRVFPYRLVAEWSADRSVPS